MAAKTPYKVNARIQIERADNNNIIEREINLTNIAQNAILEHLVSIGLAVDESAALVLIERWRIRTIWIDEPEV